MEEVLDGLRFRALSLGNLLLRRLLCLFLEGVELFLELSFLEVAGGVQVSLLRAFGLAHVREVVPIQGEVDHALLLVEGLQFVHFLGKHSLRALLLLLLGG